MRELLDRVLERIRPTPAERERVRRSVATFMDALGRVLERLGVGAEAELEGSYAKDTWLSGDVDVDVFLLFDRDTPVEELGPSALTVGREVASELGAVARERYASHPYLEVVYDGIRFDLVPAYRVGGPGEIVTPVDRTPFHTRYVRSRLNERLRDEVRLLKRFMKGVGVYGAEIRVLGFSGYLAELLVIYYGGFLETVRAASGWRPYRTFIDPEGYYRDPGSRLAASKVFNSPLIVIDPVDKTRNVASAVSLQRMSEFVAACRLFLEKPSEKFFFPPPQPEIGEGEIRRLIAERGTYLLALKTIVEEGPEDVLWGQIRRGERKITDFLEKQGFTVLDTFSWSSGREVVMVVELERGELPSLHLHQGPPVHSDEWRRFVDKYSGREGVFGPYVRGDRWVVLRPPRFRDALEAILRSYRGIGLSRDMVRYFSRHLETFTGPDVARASASPDYRRELYLWLLRRPPWLS